MVVAVAGGGRSPWILSGEAQGAEVARLADDWFSGQLRSGVAAFCFSAEAKDRGMVAGNGGQMAETEQELKEGKKTNAGATGETVAASKTPEPGAEPQRAESARRGDRAPKVRAKAGSAAHGKKGGRGKQAAEGGAESLMRAADRQVKRNCKKLSQLLVDKAMEGNIGSARLLFMLAERKKPREKPVKKSRWASLAMKWAAEPKWEGGEEESDE